MQLSGRTTQTLMAVIATILVVSALRATQPISMPLAFAFFIAVLVYPLQRWFNHYMPHWLSLVLVLLLLAGVLGLGVGALTLSAEIIEPKAPEYLNRLQQMAESVQSWAQVQRSFPSRTSDRLINAVGNMSDKLRRYLFVMTFTSFLTGLLTSIWCFILGIDLAFVWGLVGFVLNYIPTLGSIIAVIPPTLVALVFNGVGRGIATLIGLAVIQVAMGNFVDPRLQGKTLQLSPLVALISIVFWGWVWGIPGAILGVPMTVAIILLCQEFESTRGIAIVLGEEVEKSKQ